MVATSCESAEPPVVDDARSGEAPTEEEGWIVAASLAPSAVNPEFAESDAVILDELVFENGAEGLVVELPEGAGLGVVWLSAPGDADVIERMGSVSPLELVQAYGTASTRDPRLVENHAQMAANGRVPATPRDVLSLGTTRDPLATTQTSYDVWCPDTDSDGDGNYSGTGGFLWQWEFTRYSCPYPSLCGNSANNNHDVISLNDYYIVTTASAEHALQACNGVPIGTDKVSMQIQYKNGTGGWTAFYTQHQIPVTYGVAFTAYGLTVHTYRMRVYNASVGTATFAAAQW